jgi:hypothetical protein
VNEYIRPVFASDESVALGVVEPLDLSFVLSHRFLPFFHVLVLNRVFSFGCGGLSGELPPILHKTPKGCERLIDFRLVPQK